MAAGVWKFAIITNVYNESLIKKYSLSKAEYEKWQTENLVRLEDPVFDAVKRPFVAADVETTMNARGRVTETVLVWAHTEALRDFRNFGMRVRTLRMFEPRGHADPHTLILKMNALYDYNPNLTQYEIFERLNNLMMILIKWEVLEEPDYDIDVVFKWDKWLAFVNLADTLSDESCAMVCTFLRNNEWKLPEVPDNIHVQFGDIRKKEEREAKAKARAAKEAANAANAANPRNKKSKK